MLRRFPQQSVGILCGKPPCPSGKILVYPVLPGYEYGFYVRSVNYSFFTGNTQSFHSDEISANMISNEKTEKSFDVMAAGNAAGPGARRGED